LGFQGLLHGQRGDSKLPLIVGSRLTLRPMVEDDAELIVQWRNDPEIMKWMFAQWTITVSSHLHWFRARGDGRIDYIICLKNDLLPIGTINLAHINRVGKTAETGRILGDKTQWGKGYAQEAYILWLHFAFFKIELETVYSRTLTSNVRNIVANRRLGFEILSVEKSVELGAGRVADIVTMRIAKTAPLVQQLLAMNIEYQYQ
jgi:RimJ/RimL family protein N-acetyltransferase